MSAKRILLVDDQRMVTSLLRSALETLGRDYIIVEVPSGEEALLELGRGGADLLVVDVRLPGISGLEVARRARRLNPKTPIILISGAANIQMEVEAQSLGVLAFLKKPISVDTFLPVAQRALGEQSAASAGPLTPEADQPGISERLSTLRRDLGADAVYLVDMQGRVNMRAGDITRFDLDPVIAEVVAAMNASLKVSRLLNGLIPANVQFFDGDEFDIYAANVGQFYAIIILFDGDRGAGQMGPVMRYGRQCADDLLNSLVMLGVKMDEPVAFAPRPPAGPAPAPRPAPAPGGARPPAGPPKPEIVYKAGPSTRPGAQPPPAPPRAPARPAPAPPPPPVEAAPAKPLTEAELKALDEALSKVKAQDANAFWDSLNLETEADEVRPDAVSFEDAEKMGLVKK